MYSFIRAAPRTNEATILLALQRQERIQDLENDFVLSHLSSFFFFFKISNFSILRKIGKRDRCGGGKGEKVIFETV